MYTYIIIKGYLKSVLRGEDILKVSVLPLVKLLRSLSSCVFWLLRWLPNISTNTYFTLVFTAKIIRGTIDDVPAPRKLPVVTETE